MNAGEEQSVSKSLPLARSRASAVIARSWSGRVPARHADGFDAHLRVTGLAESMSIAGCLGAEILRRPDGELVEFKLVTYWDSLEALRTFAGEAVDEAVLYPGDELFELIPSRSVEHYELCTHQLRLPFAFRVVMEEELRNMVSPFELLEATRDAFMTISAGRTRSTFGLLPLDDGDVHIKAAHVAGESIYVVKFASWTPTNAARGLPAGNGGILVFNASTGAPLAFLADGHYLTDIRTASAGALATDLLAEPHADSAAVLGAGVQARLQILTLARLRPLRHVLVWARRRDAAEALVAELGAQLPSADIKPAATIRDALQAEIVVTATASRSPLISAAWLRPGQHLTALGADDNEKRELDLGCFSRADLIAVDSRDQTGATAELGAARSAGLVTNAAIVELGELFAGTRQGRTMPSQITIAKLTGVAVQDLACARIVLERLGLSV